MHICSAQKCENYFFFYLNSDIIVLLAAKNF